MEDALEVIENGINLQEHPMLVGLLQQTALFLWKDWPRNMQAILRDQNERKFTMRGVCPHCAHDSAFLLVTSVHISATRTEGLHRWIAGMQCQACLKYILASVLDAPYTGKLEYEEHYPIGSPDETIAEEIPEHIKPDFKEALRCRWVNGYNATAEMCRRALEASCIHLGASPKLVLEDMIDELVKKGVITPFLQKVAHKIRLGGNRAAHPADAPTQVTKQPEVALATVSVPVTRIGEEHADAIIAFTHEFFHHVYVVPKQLEQYDFSKPKEKKA